MRPRLQAARRLPELGFTFPVRELERSLRKVKVRREISRSGHRAPKSTGQIAAELEMSRTPVRQAIGRLAHEVADEQRCHERPHRLGAEDLVGALAHDVIALKSIAACAYPTSASGRFDIKKPAPVTRRRLACRQIGARFT
mgnify:CR=1 FL=1